MPLALRSEPFSPDGNLSAEGFENLLGTPSLDLLAVLMREAVQNSCDATSPETGQASVYIRIRELTEDQRRVCSKVVFGNLPEESSASENLLRVFSGDSVRVLEIADFGTTGLGGPARANERPQTGENADFVNFFRNVGAARDVEGGGGTYGYGKATLYRASKAHCIIADTLTKSRGTLTRRFMAAQMGRAIPGRYTGRHWWGQQSNSAEGTVDPLTGTIAKSLSERLGMPRREAGPEEMGTTIMILAPHLPTDTREVIHSLTEYLLWYFWPRMMKTTPKGKVLKAHVAWGKENWVNLPEPEKFAPLDLLCKAMNSIRGVTSEEHIGLESGTIQCHNPRTDLGQLVLARGQTGPRRWLLPPRIEGDSESRLTSIIPERLHHVALMRPVQLVVRYEKGADLQGSTDEWGGVFICSEDPEIESAFAKSEPPAHDDWQPESLPKRSYKRRFVNVALRRIRERINTTSDSLTAEAGENGPLAKASTAMGSLLPGSRSCGADRGRGRAGGKGKVSLFTQPSAAVLVVDSSGGPVAEFTFEVSRNFIGRQIVAYPVVMIDGHMFEPDKATGFPKVLEWVSPDDSRIIEQPRLTPEISGIWKARVSVPPDIAVGLQLREIERDS